MHGFKITNPRPRENYLRTPSAPSLVTMVCTIVSNVPENYDVFEIKGRLRNRKIHYHRNIDIPEEQQFSYA